MLNVIFAILSASILVLSFKPANTKKVLSNKDYSLLNRNKDPYVNDVFADNILLTLAYMDGKLKAGRDVSWDKIKTPKLHILTLKPGQTFAFHNQVLNKYKERLAATTNAHFNSTQGFKSDGWLIGDGVCHLASFMKVVAQSAGLLVEAPTNHDFAKIEDVPKEDGVSIYYTPHETETSKLQNLYITNNRSKPIAFVFNHTYDSLSIKVEELN